MAESTPERWLPIAGYEGFYEVSDLGRIRSVDRVVPWMGRTRSLRGKVLNPSKNQAGHLVVGLSREGVQIVHKVHQVVIRTFVGPQPEGMDTRHLNGIHEDNRLVNLRYGTRRENVQDMIKHRGHPNALKTHCKWGHPLSGDNLYVSPSNGQRCCRACRADQSRRRYLARKAG